MAEASLMCSLLEAVQFAALKHRDQRRKDEHKTPYINHPIGVAHLLWKEGGVTDVSVLQVYIYTGPGVGTCEDVYPLQWV